MKFTNVIYTTLLAVASIECTAIADPEPKHRSWHGECYRAGETCSKLKRAADVAAEATFDGQPGGESCGDECLKMKRDALALAEATAEVFAAADPEAHPCHAPGAPCSKAKRDALDECEKASVVPRSTAKSWQGYCYRTGETCGKLKRAAEVVAEAIASPIQSPEGGSGSYGSCSPTGEHCSNQKRALDDVNSLLDTILLR